MGVSDAQKGPSCQMVGCPWTLAWPFLWERDSNSTIGNGEGLDPREDLDPFRTARGFHKPNRNAGPVSMKIRPSVDEMMAWGGSYGWARPVNGAKRTWFAARGRPIALRPGSINDWISVLLRTPARRARTAASSNGIRAPSRASHTAYTSTLTHHHHRFYAPV